MQQIYIGINNLETVLKSLGAREIFLVCSGKSSLWVADYVARIGVKFTMFSDFTPNPKQEDAQKAAFAFNGGNFDAILAAGGGSSLDVAKFIKQDTDKPLIAVPTTAGSGSESTKFCVIYKDGIKQSIHSEKIIPEYAVLEPSALKSLPLYQKKCTMLDALCQAIEAYWSLNSSPNSQSCSQYAIQTILKNYGAYMQGDERVFVDIMLASNKAGQAINLAQTTAAHAMSYKITSTFNLPHGHAVAICLPAVWQFMQSNIRLCTDPRGEQYLKKTLDSLDELINLQTFNDILKELEIHPPQPQLQLQLKLKPSDFAASVNTTRLSNFPIELSPKTLQTLYSQILKI